MATSLAQQLTGIRANNNATILDKSKRKKIHSVSLVYDPREAATQDFESIYYDCLEAYRELESIDKRFGAFSNSLFSETSIRFDRLGQNNEQAAALNQAIEQFLMLVAAYAHLTPAFRALEWLVRRFHVQIHNAEALLLAMLPWHDTEEFVRILDIVAVPQFPALFQFLVTSKQSMQGPSKTALVRVFAKDHQLHEVVNAFELSTIARGYAYDRQVVFWSSVNIYVAVAHKEQGEPQQATDKVLPPVGEVLAQTKQPKAQIAAYMVLIVLATQFNLSQDVLDAATETIVMSWSPISKHQGLQCVAQLVQSSDDDPSPFNEKIWNAFLSAFESVVGLCDALCAAARGHKVENLVQRAALSCLRWDIAEVHHLMPILRQSRLSKPLIEAVLEVIYEKGPFSPNVNAAFVEFVELAASKLNDAQLDKLELALQSSITRPANMEPAEHESEDEAASQAPPQPVSEASLKQGILEAAANMEQSTHKFFLDRPLAQSDTRAQLWVRASGLEFDVDSFRQIARVSPDAELSFALAIAIGPWPTVSRVAALNWARSSIAEGVDYQATLPIELFLLSDPERRVRQGAAELIARLNDVKPAKSSRWGNLNGLKWLNKNDLQSVVKRLTETLEECVMDREYVFHAARQAGKAAWCDFLVSHALTTQLPQVLWITVRALASFKGVVKQLAPLMEDWNKPNTQERWEQLAADAKFPLSGLDKALIKTVRSNDAHGISFLIEIMRQRDAALASVAGDHIGEIWKADVLRPENRERLAEAMVDISVNDAIIYDPAEVLNQLQPFSAALFTRLLDRSHTEKPLFNEATAKRRRRRSSSTVQLRGGPEQEITAAAEIYLRRSTLVLELLERSAYELDESAKLLAILFDILEELMALGQDSRLPVLYTEELLANCMINLVEGLKSRDVKPNELSTLKVNVAVSCIRTSSSPQVQNRLLLLIAALATLCPDVVLHSVMPIFTFMGANTVRLDNDFSAHVIQQTIEQVIPALVACGDKHEEIEMALMSFVAAFPHIPRHRRNKLFGALIKTLGADQSLYKLLLLLGQRYAAAANAKKLADAKALVHFATPFLRSFSVGEQLTAINAYIKFVASSQSEKNSRFGLLKIREEIDSSPRFCNSLYEFLVKTAGESEVIAGTHPLRTQISKLSETQWQLGTSMVDLLLTQSLPAASELLVKCLELLPIDRFVQVIRPLVTADNRQVLELVSTKFEYEASDDAVALEAAEEIVDMFVELIIRQPTSLLIDTLDPIVMKFGPKLHDAETKLLQVLLGDSGLQSSDPQVVISAICCINTLSQHLGAALFGFFPRIFPVLCAKVADIQKRAEVSGKGEPEEDAMSVDEDDEDDEEDGQEGDDLQLATFSLFAGFVRLIPAFMTPETPQVLELLLASHISAAPRARVLEVLEEQLQPRELLRALSQSWSATLKGGLPSMQLFFTALNSVVDRCAKKDVAAEASTLTNLILACFTTRSSSEDTNLVNQVEASTTENALAIVLKLNDRVFRPLFVKIVQWGFDGDHKRQIPVLKLAIKIFGHLKGIVTNYFGYILDDVANLLENFDSDAVVRKLALQALTLSFTYDQDDFWQSPSRFDRILGLLLAQLGAEPMTHGPLIIKALTGLALISSPQHRKKINDGLAQRITADSPTTQKVWTIKILSSLYTKLGEEWVANLPQLVPLIAELLDDEDESVELETRKSLVPVIEEVLGESLDRYLA